MADSIETKVEADMARAAAEFGKQIDYAMLSWQQKLRLGLMQGLRATIPVVLAVVCLVIQKWLFPEPLKHLGYAWNYITPLITPEVFGVICGFTGIILVFVICKDDDSMRGFPG